MATLRKELLSICGVYTYRSEMEVQHYIDRQVDEGWWRIEKNQ